MQLTLLEGIDWKRISIAVLIVIVLACGAFIYQQYTMLAETEVVYSHPRIERQHSSKKITGPKLIWRSRKKYPDHEESDEVSYDAGSFESTKDLKKSGPLPLADALAPARTDRYILGFQHNIFRLSNSWNDWREYQYRAGYGLRNRVDFVYGFRPDESRHSLTVDLRF